MSYNIQTFDRLENILNQTILSFKLYDYVFCRRIGFPMCSGLDIESLHFSDGELNPEPEIIQDGHRMLQIPSQSVEFKFQRNVIYLKIFTGRTGRAIARRPTKWKFDVSSLPPNASP